MTTTPTYERHTLAHINFSGRERIFAETLAKGFAEYAIGEMLLPERYPNDRGILGAVPGIVRREEISPQEGYVPIGFASWRSSKNGRLRVGSFALPGEIISVTSPEEVAAKAPTRDEKSMGCTPALAAFSHLYAVWGALPLKLGIWGSAAMEIETGHAYTHQWSDLDIRVLPDGPTTREKLEQRLEMILATEKKFCIRIDAELRALDEYGVSLKELLNDSTTVLGKGRTDVVLLQKTDVFAGLAENRSGIACE